MLVKSEKYNIIKAKCDEYFIKYNNPPELYVSMTLILDGQDKGSVSLPARCVLNYRWDIIGRGLEILESKAGNPSFSQIDFRFEPLTIGTEHVELIK